MPSKKDRDKEDSPVAEREEGLRFHPACENVDVSTPRLSH
jgi:hypothetical protein